MDILPYRITVLALGLIQKNEANSEDGNDETSLFHTDLVI